MEQNGRRPVPPYAAKKVLLLRLLRQQQQQQQKQQQQQQQHEEGEEEETEYCKGGIKLKLIKASLRLKHKTEIVEGRSENEINKIKRKRKLIVCLVELFIGRILEQRKINDQINKNH